MTEKSKAVGFSEKMAAVEESMDSLSFADYSLNRIWCERAIYDMGFGRGIEAWKPSLPRGGVLAVSEMTWRCPEPPSKIAQHPESEYPELGTAFEKIAVVERAGLRTTTALLIREAMHARNATPRSLKRLS